MERRYFNRFLKEPKWYANNPNVETRCWFTEEGFEKYHHVMEQIISDTVGYRPMNHFEVRVIQKETLNNVVYKGKIQCIELLTQKETK